MNSKTHLIKCIFCEENTQHIQLDQYANYTLIQCTKCKIIRKEIKNLNEKKIQYLQDIVYDNLDVRTQTKFTMNLAVERLQKVKKYLSKGNLLEIGCATGEFIQVATDSGYHTIGVDSSKLYSEFAKRKGLNVFCANLEEMEFKDPFDMIVMFHLIEHIHNPKQFLKKIHALISKSGLLYIITPNTNGLMDKPFGFRHPLYIQPDHLFFFSKATLSNLLVSGGFKIVEVSTRETPHNFFGSLKGYFAGIVKRKNKNFDPVPPLLHKKRSFIKRVIDKTLYIAGFLFYPVLKPLALIAQKNDRGHELIIIARKI